MNSEPLVRVDRVVVGYDTPVCQPISFRLDAGEIIGLSGPNGAGKSTLIEAMTGGARIFSGSIQRRPGIGVTVLEQQPERLPESPVTGEDLLRACDALSRPVPETLVPLLDRRLDALSGGQAQLIHVWACFGGDASLVLLDEPTNHLDPGSQAALVRLLAQGRNGRGLLVVSHHHGLLAGVCDRVVEMEPLSCP